MEYYHTHNGIDSPKLKPIDQEGFPIFDAVPNYKTSEGQIVLVSNGGNYYLYAMINKVWRGVQLPL